MVSNVRVGILYVDTRMLGVPSIGGGRPMDECWSTRLKVTVHAEPSDCHARRIRAWLTDRTRVGSGFSWISMAPWLAA